VTGRHADCSDASNIFAALIAGTAWGQITRYGVFHALRQAWWDQERWVPACNRHASYTDMQLVSLDSQPGVGVCAQAACQMSYRHWKRYSRG
jgi:hypothetical protein